MTGQWWRRFTAQQVIGIVVVILAAITMVIAVSGNMRLEASISCQAAFNNEYRNALAERTRAADEERIAQRTLIVAITQSTGNDPVARRNQSRDALNTYLSSLNDADHKRDQNPLPPPRRC